MPQEKQHHHPFHHKEDESTNVYAGNAGNAGNIAVNAGNMYALGNVAKAGNMYAAGNAGNVAGKAGNMYAAGNVAGNPENVDKYDNAKKEEQLCKLMEQLSRLGAVGTVGFKLYEKQAAKEDPEQAHRHKIMPEVAATGALAGGGYVLHERPEKKDAKKEGKNVQGKKHVYEKQAAKKDPEQAHRHKIMSEVAATGALAGGVYILHKHHEKKDSKKEGKEAEGKKHRLL